MVVPGVRIEVTVAFWAPELVLTAPVLVWGSHVNSVIVRSCQSWPARDDPAVSVRPLVDVGRRR